MIDLRNTCILVRTPEENKKLLKEAEKQGFHWFQKDHCEPLPEQHFPDVLKFYNGKYMAYSAHIGTERDIFHEASELLETKEMTAREFIEWYINMNSLCGDCMCTECVLSKKNTKSNRSLCNTCDWKNNVDELIEIAKSGRITVPTSEEKAIDTLEKFIENPDRTVLNDEFVESLKLAVEKLKEAK